MQLSTFTGADSFAVIQERHSTPLASILSHINPFHTTQIYIRKIYLNIIHPP
jgi:hypothetical protein